VLSDSDTKLISEASRINVVGTSGSGKSTFAQQLADIKGCTYIEMDRLFWKPNWEESTDEEYLPKIDQATSKDRWILDGSYSRTRSITWPRTQVVIFLDLPFLQTLFRVTRRAIERSQSGTEIWPGTGNKETFRKTFFSSDSIVWWVITHFHTNRKRLLNPALLNDYPNTRFVHLESSSEVERCLSQIT